MRTLILSCNTGEGHNSCSAAIQEYMTARGEKCDIEDALAFISPRASSFISGWHVRIYRHFPFLFRFGYRFSEKHPAVFHEDSKVYRMLAAGAQRLYEFICDGGYDCVICPHVLSALMLTAVRKQYGLRAASCLLATDYTCSPSGKDSGLDLCFIPDEALADEFLCPAIPMEKIVISGIPVRQMFYRFTDKPDAKALFGVPAGHKHLLMMCGSMGCGPMERLAKILSRRMAPEHDLTIVCGTNRKLKARLERKYAAHENIHIAGYVEDMSALLDSADLYLTKPGGISVTEAALKALPMVLIDAVAGCEEHNRAYFLQKGGAVTGSTAEELADACLALLADDEARDCMAAALAAMPKHNAAQIIHDCMQGVQMP